MQPLPQPIFDAFEKMKTKEKHIELRQIKGHFYVYRQKCRWNKQRKKPVKSTELLGSIASDGTYIPKHPRTPFSTTKIYEYGNSTLCHTLSSDLTDPLKNTPYKEELLALSIIRAIDPVPIRLAESRWEKTYHSTKMTVDLSPKHVSNVLAHIGNMVAETYELYGKLSSEGGMLFYDLTSVLSYSKRLKFAERGYNPEWEQTNQIKVAMAFSVSTYLPIAIDVFYGSMKETKIIKYFLDRFPNKDIGFIMDRGFTDYEMLLDFKKQKIHYIAALKKNSKLLPSSVKMTGAFCYRKRNIAFFKKSKKPYGFLYLFEDPQLRGEEENFLLSRVAEGKLSMDDYRLEQRLAGVIGILSDLDTSAQVVYEQYKGREEIEQAFDVMKNDLEADKTYLGSEDAVRGYFLVVLLAMRIHFKILRRLRERELVGKVSVREVLFELSKMEMIVEQSGRQYLCAIPKRTEQILSAFADYTPIA
ncbi:MAG: transposase [Chlamydiota bacterium]